MSKTSRTPSEPIITILLASTKWSSIERPEFWQAIFAFSITLQIYQRKEKIYIKMKKSQQLPRKAGGEKYIEIF